MVVTRKIPSPKTSFFMNKMPFVMTEEMPEAIPDAGVDVASYAESAKLHSALSGSELHDPKNGTDINPNSVKLPLIANGAANLVPYENSGTIVMYDNGVQHDLRIYMNGAWSVIV